MTFQLPSLAYASTTTIGTGTLTLTAPPNASLRSFQTAFGAGGVTVVYMIRNASNGVFERGVGVFTSPSTLTRVTVIASSNGGALVSLAAGTYDVFAPDAGFMAPDIFTGNKTQALADHGNVQLFTGTSAPQTYTLLARSLWPLGFQQRITNGGTKALTIHPAGTDTINGVAADQVLQPGEHCELFCGALGSPNDVRLDRGGTNTPITKSFVDTDQTVAFGGALTRPHGFAATPLLVRCQLVAQSTLNGYTAGDVLEFPPGHNGTITDATGIAIVCDATNINVRFGSSGLGGLINKTSGANFSPGASDFKLRVSAFG